MSSQIDSLEKAQASQRRAKRQPHASPLTRKKARQGFIYALPSAVLIVALFIVPIGIVFFMSGQDWLLLGGNKGPNFPANYQDVVSLNAFWPAIKFTLKYTVIATVLLIGIGLGLALIVQESGKWRSFLRTSFLLPTSLGLASASLLFYALYSPQVGPISPFLDRIGLTHGPVSILGTPDGALWATVFLIVWRFAGFYMLLLLVGLQGISGDIYEAARIDGASPKQIFTKITLPLLKPSLALSTIMCVTGSLLAFDQFYILTKGGPDGSTLTVVQLIYELAFVSKRHLGIAAALSVLVLIALVIVNVFQLRAMRGKEES